MEEQRLLKKREKAAGNNTALATACTDLALHYGSIGQYSKAIKEYEVACNLYKEENKMILYAQANRSIGEAYMGLQEYHKALKHFKIYHEVAIQEHDVIEQQRALAQLGHLNLTWYLDNLSENNTKLLEKAYECFIKSLKICDSLPDTIDKQDMLARLFSNLGVVKENLGDYKNALALYEKSIKICLKHDIYEQLYRGYLSMASLFEKQDMYQETVKHYNLAIEVAKTLSSNRVELICGALLLKSKTLIRISDFQGAKQVLRKAYKFKTPNKDDRKVIERHLRVVASMCKVEDDIITCNDRKQLKVLYEKMGDGACDLENFTKAIEYYKKMLESAEKTGVSDKQLGECYFSLAETYKDNGNFKEAEFYFEKEYNLCKNNLKESLNTICKIADLKETANAPVEEIKKIYERGLVNCKKKHNLKEEKRLITRYMHFLRRSLSHKEAFKVEQYLNSLNEKLGDEDDASSSSEYESEDSAKVHIGDDIVLSDVTDVSEESDNEVPESTSIQQSKRRKPSTIKFKKNLNGEWPLHVACIKGDRKMVQHWLDVDHPVNVRDHAGWLPLHEAAVHGHVDIVGLLLDHKAAINDRGGSECNGITPLHDAASNGHLEVMELLLDRGASAVAKTDDGNTPLYELKRWYERNRDTITSEQRSLHDVIAKRLEEALDKAGQKDIIDSPGKENVCKSNTKVGNLRRNIYIDEEFGDEEVTATSKRPALINEEDFVDSDEWLEDDLRPAKSKKRRTDSCEFLWGRNKSFDRGSSSSKSPAKAASSHEVLPLKPTTSKRPALINEEDFVDSDEWLEDDLRPAKPKKRPTDSCEFLWGRNKSFDRGSSSSKSPAKATSSHEEPPIEIIDEYSISPRRYSNESNQSKRRTQVTLMDSGFSRERTTQTKSKFSLKLSQTESVQPKITKYRTEVEADSTTITRSPFKLMEPSQSIADPMLHVDVEIEGRVFRVPVLMSQIQVKTIKWLAEEAARRYECKEFMKPVLELETCNGAILGDNDSLSLLFSLGSVQAEKVVGKVTEWSLPSVLERYQETCTNMGVDIDNDLCDLIQTLSVSLDISDRGLLGAELSPLFKALNNQKSLTEIDLSGNFLSAHLMTVLCSSLATLNNLQTLNLSCTGLQRTYLSQLASAVSTVNLNQLANLDLSDNILLKNECLKDLSVICEHLLIKKLNLSNTGLTDLTNSQNLCLKSVEYLNASYNELKDSDIKRILLWLDCNIIKTLNLSSNKALYAPRQILEVFEAEPTIALEEIHLERCGVNDSDLFQLLRLTPNITCLNLAYNPDLTSISLRRLLEHDLSYVSLMCCPGIWSYFDATERGWGVALKPKEGRATFKISGGKEAFLDCLVAMFREKYQGGLEVDRCESRLCLKLNLL